MFDYQKDQFINCPNVETIDAHVDNPSVISTGNCLIDRESEGKTLMYGCKTSVIPDSVTKINVNAFYGCKNLENLNLNKVTEISPGAFSYANIHNISVSGDNEAFKIENGCLVTKDGISLVLGSSSCTKIPDSVTSIASYAFRGNENIKSMDLNNATTIEDNAFRDCINLSNIVSNKVTQCAGFAFYNCSSLTTVDMPNLTYDSTTYNCLRCFARCTNLKTVNFPNITACGDYMFWECANLETAELPKIVSLGNGTFNGCYNIKPLDLSKVTYVGNRSLMNAKKFTSIKLGNVTNIGYEAFLATDIKNIDLTNVEDAATFANWNANAFNGLPAGGTVTLKDETVAEAFKAKYETSIPDWNIKVQA